MHTHPLAASKSPSGAHFLELSFVPEPRKDSQAARRFPLPAQSFARMCFQDTQPVSHAPRTLCNHPSFSLGTATAPLTSASLQRGIYGGSGSADTRGGGSCDTGQCSSRARLLHACPMPLPQPLQAAELSCLVLQLPASPCTNTALAKQPPSPLTRPALCWAPRSAPIALGGWFSPKEISCLTSCFLSSILFFFSILSSIF